MFSTDLMVRTHNRPFKEAPDVLNTVGMEITYSPFFLAVTDGYMGCIFVLGVAFLPCTISNPAGNCLVPSPTHNPLLGKLHNLSALMYFIVLIVYSLFLFPKTHMDMVTGEKAFMGRQKKKRNMVYYICGGAMTVSLFLTLAYMWFLPDVRPRLQELKPVMWLESVTLFAFGISWMTKGQLFFKDENYKKGP